MANKIRIRLKAYDHKLLDSSTTEIVDTAKRTGRIIQVPVGPALTGRVVDALGRVWLGTQATPNTATYTWTELSGNLSDITTFGGRRASICCSHWGLHLACSITALAPWMSSVRR